MINQELINPQSIVVVGGSNHTFKPGGNCIRNLLNGGYQGQLYAVNPKETDVQGLKCYRHVSEIPPTDLAIIAIPASSCLFFNHFSAKHTCLSFGRTESSYPH